MLKKLFVAMIIPFVDTLFIQTSTDLKEINDTYYDYDILLNDYNSREDIETTINITDGGLHEDFKKQSFKNYIKKIMYKIKNDECTNDEMNRINLKSITCLIKNISNPTQPAHVIFKRLKTVIQIWLIIYLLAAIPLWFTRGWCCCCCFCKFFKPNETVEEARKYLALNPPGVLIDERGTILQYEPTIYEKECYEKCGHLIRTIY